MSGVSRKSGVPARISLVTLAAHDLPTLRRFYQGLGWPESKVASDDFTVFQTGGGVLALWPAAEMASHAKAPVDAPSGFVLSINVEQPEQVDEAVAGWVAAGGTEITPAQTESWGGRSANVADPEGNRWEIAWNPETTFDERGGMFFP